jgi:hypothetical protein
VRVVCVELGDSARVTYTVPAEVLERYAAALREWNPAYRVIDRVIDPAAAAELPELPYWRLWRWE